MRIAVLILASYISFLTVQPMVSPVYVCELKVENKKDSCCEKSLAKECQKQNSEEDPCANGICNPFGQCTCCLAAPEPSIQQFSKVTQSLDFNVLASVSFFSSYLADCFHPPEVV